MPFQPPDYSDSPLDSPVPEPQRPAAAVRPRKRGVVGGWLSMAPMEQTEPDPQPMSATHSGLLAPHDPRRHATAASASFYDPLRPGLVSSTALSRHGSMYDAAGEESSANDSPSPPPSPPPRVALDPIDDSSRPASADASPVDSEGEAQPFDYRSLLRPMTFGRPSNKPSSIALNGTTRSRLRPEPPSASSGTPLSGPQPAPTKRPKAQRELSFEPPAGLLPVDPHRRRRHRRRAKVILTPRGNNHIVNGGGGLKMTGVEWSGKTLVAVEQEMERLGKQEWMSYSPDPDYLSRRLEALRKNMDAQEREDEWRAQQGFGPLYQQKRWVGPDYPSTPLARTPLAPDPLPPPASSDPIPAPPTEKDASPVERSQSSPTLPAAAADPIAASGSAPGPAPDKVAPRKSAGKGMGFLKVNEPIENAVPHAPMVSPPATPERKAVALGSDSGVEDQGLSSSTPEDYEMTNALAQFHLRPPTILTQSNEPPLAPPVLAAPHAHPQVQDLSDSPTSPETPALAPPPAPAPPPTQAFSQWGPSTMASALDSRDQKAKAERAAQLARVASADAVRLYRSLPPVDYASQRDALQQRVTIRDARRPDLEQIADLHCLFGETDDQPSEDSLYINRDNVTTSATFLLRLLIDENYVAVVAVAKPLPEPPAPIHISRPDTPYSFHPRESAIPEAEEEDDDAVRSSHTADAARGTNAEPTPDLPAQAQSAPINLGRRREAEDVGTPEAMFSSSLDSDVTQTSLPLSNESTPGVTPLSRAPWRNEETQGTQGTRTGPTSYGSYERPSSSISPLITKRHHQLSSPFHPSPGVPDGDDEAVASVSDQLTDRPKSAAGGLLEPPPMMGDAIPGPEYLAPPPLQRVMATAPPRGRPVEREMILGVATANVVYHPPPNESFDLRHGEAGIEDRLGEDTCSTIHVLSLSVQSTERHQGLGAWLLETLLERAQARLMDHHRIAQRWANADRELRASQSVGTTRHPSRTTSRDRMGQDSEERTANTLRGASSTLQPRIPRMKAYLQVHPSNKRACALYDRLGFTRTTIERGYYRGDRRIPSRIRLIPGGQDAWKYEKWL